MKVNVGMPTHNPKYRFKAQNGKLSGKATFVLMNSYLKPKYAARVSMIYLRIPVCLMGQMLKGSSIICKFMGTASENIMLLFPMEGLNIPGELVVSMGW